MVVDFTTGLVVESSTSPVECSTTGVVETTAGETVFFFSIVFSLLNSTPATYSWGPPFILFSFLFSLFTSARATFTWGPPST